MSTKKTAHIPVPLMPASDAYAQTKMVATKRQLKLSIQNAKLDAFVKDYVFSRIRKAVSLGRYSVCIRFGPRISRIRVAMIVPILKTHGYVVSQKSNEVRVEWFLCGYDAGQ